MSKNGQVKIPPPPTHTHTQPQMSNGGPLRSRPIHEIQVNSFNQSAVTLKSTSRRPRDATSYIYSLPFQKQGQEYSFKHKFKSIIEYNLARVAIIDGGRCCKQGCISDMLRIILLNLFSLSITGWLDGSVSHLRFGVHWRPLLEKCPNYRRVALHGSGVKTNCTRLKTYQVKIRI